MRALVPVAAALLGLAAGCPQESDDVGDDAPAADAARPDGSPYTGLPITFRIATWNVHDLFDETDRLSPPGELDEVYTTAQVEAKLSAVATAVARIDADLVVFQEVENQALLERLIAGPLAGAGYLEARLIDAYDPRGIDIGVISKHPVESYISHLGERDPTGAYLWSRDAPEIHLRVGGRRVLVVGAHLISQADGNDQRRTYQAQGTRDIADALAGMSPDAIVAVAGDLNDTPTSAPLVPLLGDDVYEDLGARLSSSVAWTYENGSYQSRLDYVLLHSRASEWVTDVHVDGGDGVSTSDHRPVVVTMTYPGL